MTHPTHETHGEWESRNQRLAAEHAEVSTIWTGAHYVVCALRRSWVRVIAHVRHTRFRPPS